jgi:two-component system chemotaxis response regulator CheY
MKRCLVVDDSRVIRRVAAKIIEDLGFETCEAESGQRALALCAARMPEIVLLDWEMPQMDGLEVAKALRALPGGAAATIIFCATCNDPAGIKQALDAGADEYIMKPFDSEIVSSKFLLLGLLP